MFKDILPLTIGLIVFAISFTLQGLWQKSSKEREQERQEAIKKREDDNRRLNRRSTWMLDKAKYYIRVYSDSLMISNLLKKLKDNIHDPCALSNTLYSIICFLDGYTSVGRKLCEL
jgi:hypothetical protein